MNDMLSEIFGTGTDLSLSQMVLRGVVVFVLTLLIDPDLRAGAR